MRFLPVAFIVGVLFTVYGHYVTCYLPWRLSNDKNAGLREMVIFHILVGLLSVNYVLAAVTPAGDIPESDEWRFKEEKLGSFVSQENQQERKRNGQRRHCKWCAKLKPDRAHHCRVCQRCVLRMDHHCPWIFNCVGFNNHKYFILLLVYTVAACLFVTCTLPKQWAEIYAESAGFFPAFLGTVVNLLCLILGVVVGAFLGFHLYLTFSAMTTIEYCEKKRPSSKELDQETENPYYRGVYGNIAAVFGANPLLWLLPVSSGRGDGMHFPTAGPDGSAKGGSSSKLAARKRIAARLSEKFPEEVAPMINNNSHDSSENLSIP